MSLRKKNKTPKPLPDYNPILKFQKSIFIVFAILLILGGALHFFSTPEEIQQRPFIKDLEKAKDNL